MTILLTGGCGYIGSHTALELIRSGYDVVLADDLSNSNDEAVSSIYELTGKNPKLYVCNVCDSAELGKIFNEQDIGAVIHFAAYKSVPESVIQPLMYYRNNLDALITLLETMNKFSVKNLVFSSSATVYGNTDKPCCETMPAAGAENPYGNTKLFCERIIEDSSKAYGISSVILRYFNPIGADSSGLLGEYPNGVPGNLMPYITQTALGIRDILHVYGNDYPTPDGTGVRDYIHITDLAKGHISALEYSFEHSGTEVFNLGTGKGTSVLEVINAFEKATGIVLNYDICKRRPGDTAISFADATKAEAVLGWKAELDIHDMCADAWRWEQRHAEKSKKKN